MLAHMKQHWPAPERNKEPILALLRRVLPERGTVLEIASGSGQHAAFFARELPALTFQPSDVDEENLRSIEAWVAEEKRANLLPPRRIDVTAPDWAIDSVDAVFNANMIHIAPWVCCEGLMRGVGRYLKTQGVFVLYGPFRLQGAHTSESNERFDQGLRARDPSWGVRDAEAVIALAAAEALTFVERVAMPANNQCLVFRHV
jgi:SAM-dependent methyltransferase